MPCTIMVVDDEVHILEVLRLKLQNAGYVVVTARNGEEALTLARQAPPDLVITDYQMPCLTGVELCRSLLEHAPTATIPVIILTARGYALADEDVAVPNIRNVVAKPFSPRAILSQVETLLAESGSERSAA